MHSILIIDTGGTFNKQYNPLTGNLDVDGNSLALQDIASKWLCDIECTSVIGKDSLEMDDGDREHIAREIAGCNHEHIIVIHGTDTMHLSAEHIAAQGFDKTVVFTGAMVPYSIESTEATANFAMAYGFLAASPRSGVYISMHGLVRPHTHIAKSYTEGRFLPKGSDR